MSARVFISQSAIDSWVSSEQAELAGNRLSFRAHPGALELVPASLFRRISAGQTDPHSLVGKVLDEEAVLALGGETYMSSVLLGEIAYDVEPGFVGVPTDAEPRAVVEAMRLLHS
jgi:hypothetical protein